MMNKTRNPASAFILLIVMSLSACATTAPDSSDDVVAQRAQARWDALLSRDYAGAYAFYSPGFRSSVSAVDLEISMRLRRIKWQSAEYIAHFCDESSCKVRFNVGYSVNSPVPGVGAWSGYEIMEDQWIKTGGEWWYLPEEE
jgi:hypothetical protein